MVFISIPLSILTGQANHYHPAKLIFRNVADKHAAFFLANII